MELTRVQRLIISNQFKILEQLNPESSEFYESHRKAIEEGYQLHYEWAFENIYEDELSEEDCREVLEILSMYRVLHFSYEKLPEAEKNQIKYEGIHFPGFDGNNETKRMTYVEYFMHDLNRFDELREDTKIPNYNSHWEKLNDYQNMLREWQSLGKKNKLGCEEIKQILAAGHSEGSQE